MRYLRFSDGGYRLTKGTARWMLRDSPEGIRDLVLMKRMEWRWIEGLDAYVRSGTPVDVHDTMSADDWSAYQLGMRAQAIVREPTKPAKHGG